MLKTIMKFAIVGMLFGSFSASAESVHRDVQKEEANRKIIMEFFESTGSDRFDAFIDKYVVDNYKQHNPGVADGKEGLRAFFKGMMKRFPEQKARVVHTAADGDLVWVHAHIKMNPNDRGMALVDIFRLENGKLVEHWDIMQPVPEKSANNNTMF